jgi:hypothetical protein
MMHQPVDYDDARFYAAENILSPNDNGRCVLSGAPSAATTGVGEPSMRSSRKGRDSMRAGQPPSPRRGVRRALRAGAK